MKKSAKVESQGKAADASQLGLHLPGIVREALYDTVIVAGLACVDEVLEMERVALCGERYERLTDRQALRAGHVTSSLVLGGRRLAVNRPRARSVEGRELRLPSWREWSARRSAGAAGTIKKVQVLQETLHRAAKENPRPTFGVLYDKVRRSGCCGKLGIGCAVIAVRRESMAGLSRPSRRRVVLQLRDGLTGIRRRPSIGHLTRPVRRVFQ